MENKAQSAYEIIKNKIILGELKPLSDISEKLLQDELGISRTPIHEAISLLREEGFVYTFARKGTIVSDITMDMVKSVYELRLLTEPYLAKNAVGMLPEDWLLDIRQRLLSPPASASVSEEGIYLSQLDAELHARIAETSKNIFLRNSLKTVYDHTRRLRLKTIANPAQTKRSQDEHLAIVDAFLKNDARRAEREAIHHILSSRDLTYQTLGMTTEQETLGRTGRTY